MEKRRFKAKEFLWKYLLSYFLVLVLPLCSLFLFAYNHAIRLTQSNVLVSKKGSVLRLYSLLDREIKNVDDMIRDIRMKRVMQDFCPEKSGYQSYETVRKLREYTAYNRLLASIVYYREGGDYIVSDMGTIPVAYFGEKVYRWEGMSRQEVWERLTQEEGSGYRDTVRIPEMQTQDYMVYFYPQKDKEQGNATIIVFYNLNEIKEIVGATLGYDDYLRIQDSYGHTVWESGDAHKAGGKDAEAFAYNSVETGWHYQGALGHGAAAKDMMRLKSYYFGMLLGLLILGSMIIYYFLCKNYRPIQKLKNQVQELVPGLLANSMNEMETVQQAVIVLSETLEEAEKKMSEAEPVLQKAAVAGMLYGIYGERDRMPECFQKGGGTRCYLAAGIRTESGEGMETLQLLMGRMRSEEFDGVILGRPYVPETTAVFCFLAGKILEITDTLENLAAQFWRETGKNMQIFLSDPRTGTEELKHAYWETRIVSALAERRPGKSIYLYDALLTDKRKEPDSFTELLRKLEMGILSENVDGLAALSSQFALEDGSCLAGWRVNVVLATMMGITANHVGDPLTVKKLNQKISVKMEEFAESKAYGTLGKVCAEYCLDMIEALIKKEGTEGDRMRMEVLLQYIHQHAVSEEFSLSAMAEHFRLSPSWLSHYFSNNMHMTLIEYVNRLKMDVAKDMLKDSDIGLDELAKNLGYASTSSFIRSFKNIVGMTPGKYRKIGGRK